MEKKKASLSIQSITGNPFRKPITDSKINRSLLLIIVVSFVLKYPVLSGLNVSQTDRIESLSIPAQQIARVIADGKELTTEQEKLLNEIIDINAVPETYPAYISDSIKVIIRNRGN